MSSDIAATITDRFAIVLFKPKASGNVGAVARALKNMGIADLRLVAPVDLNRGAAAAMAVHGADVLDNARIYPNLSTALEGCTLTVGTTCRPGPYRSSAHELCEIADDLAIAGRSNKIAIIFGPEDFGLTNEELKLCQRLLTIPTAPEYSSLNLAQAVMIVAYELMMVSRVSQGGAVAGPQANFDEASRAEPIPRAPAAEVEAMMERLTEALIAIGFIPADNPDHIMFAIRNILGRSGLSARELDILNGLAHQIGWFAEGGRETIEAKLRAGRKIR